MTEGLKLFLAALESGQYQQTTLSLKEGDCFCAAGLACEVHRQAMEGEHHIWGKYEWNRKPLRRGESYMGHSCRPPSDVVSWLGLSDEQITMIIHLNDHSLASFSEIAVRVKAWAKCQKEAT